MCLNYDTHMAFRVNQMDDTDGDNVPDGVDCRPYDPAFQDFGSPSLAPHVGDIKHTLDGYKLNDYYFHNGNWHVRPGAKPVFKRSRFGIKRRKR